MGLRGAEMVRRAGVCGAKLGGVGDGSGKQANGGCGREVKAV